MLRRLGVDVSVYSAMLIVCFSMQMAVNELNEVDHDTDSASVTCPMCFMVEVGKSERAKMISCKCCRKKYHRNCLKSWAQHRGIVSWQRCAYTCPAYILIAFFLLADLFNWSSWACPSCRTCEVSLDITFSMTSPVLHVGLL